MSVGAHLPGGGWEQLSMVTPGVGHQHRGPDTVQRDTRQSSWSPPCHLIAGQDIELRTVLHPFILSTFTQVPLSAPPSSTIRYL